MNNRMGYEPDVIITQKFLAAKYRGAAVSSEKRLMLAVLTHALHDYQDYFLSTERAHQVLADEAAEWIQCTRNDHMFSFENVSETLGFDAGYLRRGIVAWRVQRLLTLQQEISDQATPPGSATSAVPSIPAIGDDRNAQFEVQSAQEEDQSSGL